MKTIWEKGQEDGSSGGSIRIAGGGERLGTKSIQEEECNSSSSSSIGDDSDGDREEDVESRHYQNGNSRSFDDAIQALEEALPIRRGISRFYNGKSKSFTSLADEWPSTPSEIAKPENAYTRKRRNLGAFKLNTLTGKISKKPKTTTMLHFTNNPKFTKHKHVHTQSQISRRSFSMLDLHLYNSTEIGHY